MKPEQYQDARKQLLGYVDHFREIRDGMCARDPVFVNGLPADVRHKMLLLDRESVRLRNPDMTIAFVGGFSAGKSSLVNAFLGRYLLPESTKITTAVPTFVRSTDGEECAELHYLDENEFLNLGDLYRKEIAGIVGHPEWASLPYDSFVAKVEPLVKESRGNSLVQQFNTYHQQRNDRRLEHRGRIVTESITKAQATIRDEIEAMFLDRVVLRIRDSAIPPDVVLVDLPGVSVPNPRHREITFRFVREEAHAVVFVIMATRLFDKDEIDIIELFRTGENRIAEKTFWVLNRWDSLTPQQQEQTIVDFDSKLSEFGISSEFQPFRTNALHGLLSQLCLKKQQPSDPLLQKHLSGNRSPRIS